MRLELRLGISQSVDEIGAVYQRSLSAWVLVTAVGVCRLESLECEMNYTSRRKAEWRLTLGRVRSLTGEFCVVDSGESSESRDLKVLEDSNMACVPSALCCC